MEAIINLTSIGLAFADITVDWCKKISNDSAVSQTGMTLVERGRGIYKLTNPNITEDTDCYVYETAIPANFAVAIFSPADGNFVKFYENLFDLIESQRGAHTGANMYHIGPTNGDDANDGLTRATAKKTWAGVFALCSNRAHDIIMVHADNPAGQTVWAENIDTTGKAYTFIRGPGRDLLIKPTTTNAPSVLLGAVGCEISGAVIETADNGSETALKMTADFCKGHHFFVDYSRGHGVEIAGCSNSRAHDF
ncbi:MAG: hypothetical protein KAV87_20755, partial [Desulfobacteraceae bacterium]|nr:hypothetical protein [Desulfobacteraceae bacterium]